MKNNLDEILKRDVELCDLDEKAGLATEAQHFQKTPEKVL